MKTIIEQLKSNKWIHYLIITLIGLIVSMSLFQINIRNTHDGFLHLLRLIGTDDAIQIGQIPPIIAQNYCNAAGYAMNLFYPGLATYMPLIVKIFTPTYAIALKSFGIICIILSGIAMYKFANEVTNKKLIALFAAILYIIAPYKLANVYIRYAIGEFIAAIFIPLVFLGIYSVFNKDGKKHYYIAIGATGLLLSHTISTFYTSLFCIIYILFFIKKLKEKEVIKKCVINIVFTLLMSLMFLLPMFEATQTAEYSIMVDNIMGTNGTYTSKNTIEFSQFVQDIGEENGTTFIIGMPMLLLFILSIYGMLKVDKKWKEVYIVFLIFSIVSIIMCTKFFPWSYIPNLMCKLQYPWRMLGYFIFFVSLISAINLQLIIEKINLKNLKVLVVAVSMIIMVISGLQTVNGFVQRDKEKSIEYNTKENIDEFYENSIMENKKISHMQINREYLPYKALILQNTYMREREDRIYILQGNVQIYNEEKNNLQLTANISNVSENTILEFPYIFYPGYKATLNGTTQLKLEESENGYLSTKITQDIETGTIKVEYTGTLITKISYIISIISIIVFFIYVYKENRFIKMQLGFSKDDVKCQKY